jgi:hypothetical protein
MKNTISTSDKSIADTKKKESHFDNITIILVSACLLFSPFWALSASSENHYLFGTKVWVGAATLFALTVFTVHYLRGAKSSFWLSVSWFLFSYVGYQYLSPALSLLSGVAIYDAHPIFTYIPLALGSNLLVITIEYFFGLHHGNRLKKCAEIGLLAAAVLLLSLGFVAHLYVIPNDGIGKKIILYSTVMVGVKLLLLLSLHQERP